MGELKDYIYSQRVSTFYSKLELRKLIIKTDKGAWTPPDPKKYLGRLWMVKLEELNALTPPKNGRRASKEEHIQALNTPLL